MKIACLIPARYNSTRFPGKLLQIARGKTILQRTFESALQLFSSEQIAVATDDPRIASHVESFGGTAIWTSPDCPNGTERIAEALLKSSSLSDADIIVNLQGDHPCTSSAALKAAITALVDHPDTPLSTLATPILSLQDFHSPHVVKVLLDARGKALYFSRAPIPYTKGNHVPVQALQHVGIYCFRRQFLFQYVQMESTPLQRLEDLEQLKVLEHGYPIQVAIVSEKTIGVDTPEDLVQLEQFLCR